MRAAAALTGFSLMMAIQVSPGVAQNWTAAELAVLDRVEDCVQAEIDRNEAAAAACFHPEFVGWRYTMAGTRNNAFERIDRELTRDSGPRLIGFWLQPLSIRIHGDVAVIHYYGYYYLRDESGDVSTVRNRWTDVLLDYEGNWVWIADHGGRDPGSPAS